MELKDIVSVAGVAGLHKVIGRNKTGLIVETIGSGKKFATTIQQRVSVLADIAMFTDEGEAKLWEVLKNLKALDDAGKNPPAANADNDAVKAYMATVLPAYDREKVYVSDMKKLFSWYGVLKGLLDWDKLGQETEEDAGDAETPAEKPAEKPAAKSAAPKKVKTSAPKPSGGVKAKTTTPRKMGS